MRGQQSFECVCGRGMVSGERLSDVGQLEMRAAARFCGPGVRHEHVRTSTNKMQFYGAAQRRFLEKNGFKKTSTTLEYHKNQPAGGRELNSQTP